MKLNIQLNIVKLSVCVETFSDPIYENFHSSFVGTKSSNWAQILNSRKKYYNITLFTLLALGGPCTYFAMSSCII